MVWGGWTGLVLLKFPCRFRPKVAFGASDAPKAAFGA
jgi:hypothetical protein